MTRFIVVFITCSSQEEADDIAYALVSARLAACVNALSGVRSIFHWQGKTDEAEETLLIVKSRTDLLEELISLVKKQHSYDVPEIIALPIVGGSDDYLQWIESETCA